MTKENDNRSLEEAPSRATWREWTGLAALALPVFMISTDIGALFLAMPSITADLTPSSTQMLWMLHIGEFMTVGFLLTMGRLADRIGRRRLLVIGVALYGVASLMAAFSPAAWILIMMRALLGVAAATITPSAMSLLRNMFPDPKQFSAAIAINLSAFSAGAALGPSVGGLLVDHFWWGAVFLINVPVALAFLLGALLLPTYRDSKAGSLDFVSVLLSLLALMSIIYGFQEIAENGFHILHAGAIAAGALIAVVFVRRQLRLEEPLLDLRMFLTPAFSASLLALLLILLFNFGAYMLFTQHLQTVLGFSPAQAGLLLLLPTCLSIAGTLLAPVLTSFMRPAFAMAAGLTVALFGAVLVTAFAQEAHVGMLMTGISILMFGMGPTMSIGSELILSSAPKEQASSASAVQDVGTGLGNAMGIAFMGSLGMAIYRGSLAGSLPQEIPAEARGVAMDSVGAAVAAAGQLPDSSGAEMLQAVQSSFTLAIQIAFAIAAFGLIAVALMVVWRLRHIRSGSAEESEPVDQPDQAAVMDHEKDIAEGGKTNVNG